MRFIAPPAVNHRSVAASLYSLFSCEQKMLMTKTKTIAIKIIDMPGIAYVYDLIIFIQQQVGDKLKKNSKYKIKETQHNFTNKKTIKSNYSTSYYNIQLIMFRISRLYWQLCYIRQIIGRPFVKWFALCYQTVVCLSVLSVCNVGVLWPNGWIDEDETWHGGRPGAGHIVLDEDPAPRPPKAHSPLPQFSTHVCCGQTAGWIKVPLGKEVGLGLGDIVLDGAQLSHKKGHSHPTPNFWPMSVGEY